MADDYKPISCDLHDRFEAAAVRKKVVELQFSMGAGARQTERGRIADVYSADGKEFVKFESQSGRHEIQLDHIIDMREL